jgi:hypothetical protein
MTIHELVALEMVEEGTLLRSRSGTLCSVHSEYRAFPGKVYKVYANGWYVKNLYNEENDRVVSVEVVLVEVSGAPPRQEERF